MIRLLAVTLFYSAFAGRCSVYSSEKAVGFISGNQYIGQMPGGQTHSDETYDKANGAVCTQHWQCKSGFCNHSGISSAPTCKCSGWRNNNFRGGPDCSADGHSKPWCYVEKDSGCPDKKGSGYQPWSEVACKPKEGPKIDFTKKYDGDIYEGAPGVCLISYCAGHGPGDHSDHPEMCRHRNGCPLRTVGDYCEEAWDCDQYKCVNRKCKASKMDWSDEVHEWDERTWDERRKGSLSEVAIGAYGEAFVASDVALTVEDYGTWALAVVGFGATLYVVAVKSATTFSQYKNYETQGLV